MPGVRSRSHSTLPRKCSRTPAAPLSMNAIITTLSTLRLAALSVKAHQPTTTIPAAMSANGAICQNPSVCFSRNSSISVPTRPSTRIAKRLATHHGDHTFSAARLHAHDVMYECIAFAVSMSAQSIASDTRVGHICHAVAFSATEDWMTAGPDLLLDRVRAATADEYIIEGELGRGGMAAVFLGRDIALHRHVAIKVMLPDLVGVAGSEDRFVVEARTAAQLDHPGIVTIYAVKQRAGLTFIVMKYIEGQTLDHVLATRGALEQRVVATIGSHVAEALHFAHSRGVVHRDVKPSNIIIDKNGAPVVADFGIAKVSTAPSLTMAGATIGTPAYMSPEQCRGLPVTSASDQYSLGVVLYELLTGRAPFSGTLFDLLKAHTSEAPPRILDVKPEVDPALEAIVGIMLAKNEAERFPSLRDVSKALLSLLPRRSHEADRHAIMAAVAAANASGRRGPLRRRGHASARDVPVPETTPTRRTGGLARDADPASRCHDQVAASKSSPPSSRWCFSRRPDMRLRPEPPSRKRSPNRRRPRKQRR